MSHKATNHVFELTEYPDGTKIERDEKLLLFVLADHHNVSTRDAFPSVKRLADLALMSERHARDILRKAERHGLIETVKGGGRGNTSSYRFVTLDKVGTACLVLTGKEADLEVVNSANNSASCLPGLEINSAQTRQKGGTDAFANKEEPKNLEPKPSPDSRVGRFARFIQDHFQRKFGFTCPWNGREGKTLSQLLKENPSWNDEQVAQWIRNYFKSSGVRPDRPALWLPNITRYAAGPLGDFARPSETAEPERRVLSVSEKLRARAAGATQ